MAIGFAIRPVLTLLKRAGIEAQPLLVRAGLSEEHPCDGSLRRVPSAAQAKFLEYAAEALRDSALGLHLAAEGDLRTVGLALYLGSAAKSLGEALELMTRYVSIADGCARLNLIPQPDGVALEIQVRRPLAPSYKTAGGIRARHGDQRTPSVSPAVGKFGRFESGSRMSA